MVLGSSLKLLLGVARLVLELFVAAVGVFFDLLLAADFDFFVAAGCLIMLAAFGVADVVQYHLPLANAQVWPSLALA